MKLRPINKKGSKAMLKFSLLAIYGVVIGLLVWPCIISSIVLIIIGKYVAAAIVVAVYLINKLGLKLVSNYLKKFGQELTTSLDFIKVED